jgi:hypothetical protein
MECRLTAVTLAVTNVGRSWALYCDGLGWKLAPGTNDEIALFSADGIVLAPYSRTGPEGSL